MFITNRQKRGVLTITAGERWYANCIIRGLLRNRRRNEYTLRVLSTTPKDENVRELESLGAEVVGINYRNKKSIEDALEGTDCLVAFPEDHRERIRQAEELARAADRVDIENIILMSIEGADEGKTNTQHDYCEIERIFREFEDNTVIVRASLVQQAFFLWTEAAQDEAVWPWLANRRDQFVPVNFVDVVESIRSIVCDEEERLVERIDRRHSRRTYRLTGPDAVSGDDLVDIINQSISRGEVDLQMVSRREFENYLRGLKRYEDNQKRRRGHRELYPEPFLPLSELEIECHADYLEYVNEGRAGRISNDVRELTDNEPQPVDTFFSDYSKDFEPRERRRPGRPGRRRPRSDNFENRSRDNFGNRGRDNFNIRDRDNFNMGRRNDLRDIDRFRRNTFDDTERSARGFFRRASRF